MSDLENLSSSKSSSSPWGAGANPKFFQNVALGVGLLFAKLFGYVAIEWSQILVVVLSAGLLGFYWQKTLAERIHFPHEGVGYGLILALFMQTDQVGFFLLAVILTEAAVYLFRSRNAPLMCPPFLVIFLLTQLFPLSVSMAVFPGHDPWFLQMVGLIFGGVFLLRFWRKLDFLMVYAGSFGLLSGVWLALGQSKEILLPAFGTSMILLLVGLMWWDTFRTSFGFRVLSALNLAALFVLLQFFFALPLAFVAAFLLIQLMEADMRNLEHKTFGRSNGRLLWQGVLSVVILGVLGGYTSFELLS